MVPQGKGVKADFFHERRVGLTTKQGIKRRSRHGVSRVQLEDAHAVVLPFLLQISGQADEAGKATIRDFDFIVFLRSNTQIGRIQIKCFGLQVAVVIVDVQ